MKRMMAWFLAVGMVFSFTACSDTADVDTTTTTESMTVSTEGTTTTTESAVTTTESAVTTTGKTNPTNHKHSYTATVTKKATCTEEGVKTFTCSCGNTYTEKIAIAHTFGEWNILQAPSAKREGTSQRVCSSCGTTENKTLARNYCNGLTFVGIEHKTTHYDIDGMNFFDRLYGKDTACQVGDVIIYELGTSDGRPTDITVTEKRNCSYKVEGTTLIIIPEKGSNIWERDVYVKFYSDSLTGRRNLFRTAQFTMLMTDQNIVDSDAAAGAIEDYAYKKGLQYSDELVNQYEDTITIANNPDWFRQVIQKIDAYKARGCTMFHHQLQKDQWQGVAK